MSQDKAREAVLDELAARGIAKNAFAKAAGVDPATLRDFLAGRRWPQSPTQVKIEDALGWDRGTLDRIARGVVDAPVGDSHHTGGVLLDVDESAYADLTPAEREEAITAAKLAFHRTAREIRLHRGE